MSGFTFSHKFTQHWLTAPTEVRQAIATELQDIITLLDNDTDLESFHFTHTDLNAYLDDMFVAQYQQYAAQQLQKYQNNLPHALDSNIYSKLSANNDTIEPIAEQSTNQNNSENHHNHIATDNQNTSDEYASDDMQINAEQYNVIQELNHRIDDYLNEQMNLMSQDIKTWLRDELKRQLDK